jgi:hypothetical protein
MGGLCMVLDLNLKLFFAYLSYRFQMNCWSRPSCCSGSSWGDGCWLRNTVICPKVFRCCWNLWCLWGDPQDMANLSQLIFWSMSCKTPIVEVWNLAWLISELWCLHSEVIFRNLASAVPVTQAGVLVSVCFGIVHQTF